MLFAARVTALLVCLAVPLRATSDEFPPAAPSDVASHTEADDKVLKTREMLKNLRFMEDWSALADPETRTDHWFPSIKYIELGDDWTASFGGQVRVRLHSEENRALTGAIPGDNDFKLVRTRLHGDFRYRDDLRIFIEVLSANIHGNSPNKPLGIDKQRVDLENAFIEVFGELLDSKTSFRFGRGDLQYGKQRLISPLDWANTRRQFEGVLFQMKAESVTTDIFLTHPVPVSARNADEANASLDFNGVYTTWQIGPQHLLDVYGLSLNEHDSVITNGAGMLGDRELYTAGFRFAGKSGGIDYEVEVASQFGNHAGDDIRAYMWMARAGHTFGDLPGSPRIGIDIDVASGDSDPTDGTMQTFNHLFPLGHGYLGHLDLVGRQNIVAVMPNVTIKLADNATFRAAYSSFRLNNRHDALYSAGGGATLADPSGSSGNKVGREIDLTLTWAPAWSAPHGKFLFGWSQFMPDRFVKTLGDGKRAELAYVQYSFTF